MKRKLRWCLGAALLGALAMLGRPANGSPILLVDQEAWGASGGSTNTIFGPLGQEFTPTQSGLDAVEFMIVDPNADNGLGITLQAVVRQGGMGGTIVGSSAHIALPDSWPASVVHFDFPSTVSLVPNTLYSIEVIKTGGAEIGFNLRNMGNSYAGGRAYWNGEFFPGTDFLFREGLHNVPEPGTAALAIAGVGLLWWQRRRNRNSLRHQPSLTGSVSMPRMPG